MIDQDFFELAKHILQLDEGVKSSPYKDSKGFWTIGIGHYIGAELDALKLPDSVIDMLLREDIVDHYQYCLAVFGETFFSELDLVRRVAILNIMFTLGETKFLKFRKMIEAIRVKDWTTAANELLDSKWANDVDPRSIAGKGRDDRVAYMLLRGEIPEEYNINSYA